MRGHETEFGQPTRGRRQTAPLATTPSMADGGSLTPADVATSATGNLVGIDLRAQLQATKAENRLTITIVDPESGQSREIRDLLGWVKAFIDTTDAISFRDKRLAKFVLQNRTLSELAKTNIFDVKDIRKARRDYQRLVEEELLSPAGVHQVHSYRTERDPTKGATRYDVAASKGKLPSQQFFNVRYTSDASIETYTKREVRVPTNVPEGFAQATRAATVAELHQLRKLGLLKKHGDFMLVNLADLQRIREENSLRENRRMPLPVYPPGHDSLKNIAQDPALYARVLRAIRDGKITDVQRGLRQEYIVRPDEVYDYLEKPRGRRGKAKKK